MRGLLNRSACLLGYVRSAVLPSRPQGRSQGVRRHAGSSCVKAVPCTSGTLLWGLSARRGRDDDPEHPPVVPALRGVPRALMPGAERELGSAASYALDRPVGGLWSLPCRAGPYGSGGGFVKRQRMWMEVGVWPPPARAQMCPQSRTLAPRRGWIAAGVLAAAMLGVATGSVVTLMLFGQLGRVCA